MISSDALNALDWATKNGYVSNHVGYFGFSHGSRAGIWLAGDGTRRFYLREMRMNQDLKFGTVAVIYPDCIDYEKVKTFIGPLTTSLMIWGGDKDEHEPYNCQLLWPDEKRRVKFASKIFPDTYHGYGFPGVKRQTLFGTVRTITSAPNLPAYEETWRDAAIWFTSELR